MAEPLKDENIEAIVTFVRNAEMLGDALGIKPSDAARALLKVQQRLNRSMDDALRNAAPKTVA